jgi:hypothetical protein
VCSLAQGCLQAWQLCVPDLVHCQVQQGVAMGPGQHALADAVDHLRTGRQPVSGCGWVGGWVGGWGCWWVSLWGERVTVMFT